MEQRELPDQSCCILNNLCFKFYPIYNRKHIILSAGSTLYSTDTYTFACVGEMTARHIQEHQITDFRSYLEEHMDTISQ